MSDKELYDLYVEHIWTQAPEVYQDELDACEKVILAGIKTILEVAQQGWRDDNDWLGEDQ